MELMEKLEKYGIQFDSRRYFIPEKYHKKELIELKEMPLSELREFFLENDIISISYSSKKAGMLSEVIRVGQDLHRRGAKIKKVKEKNPEDWTRLVEELEKRDPALLEEIGEKPSYMPGIYG